MDSILKTKEIYKKLFPLSLVVFLVELVGLAFVIVGPIVGLAIAGNSDNALVGLIVGFIVGTILAMIYHTFISTLFHSGFIALISKSVVSNKLPDHIFSLALKESKSRFSSVITFFLVSSAIRGAVSSVNDSITRVSGRIGGSVASGISSAISSGINTMLNYLSDCCLAWIFYKKDLKTGKAAIEGVAVFFKHKQALFANAKRIFLTGLISFISIAGVFFGIYFLILYFNPSISESVLNAIFNTLDTVDPTLTSNVAFPLVFSFVLAIFTWAILHNAFIRPYILIGVIREFMLAGIKETPTEEEINKAKDMAPKLNKIADK